MADLFESPSSSSGMADFSFDRDDVSIFLHNLLHGSSPSPSPSPPVAVSASSSSFSMYKHTHQFYCLHKPSSSHGRPPLRLLEDSLPSHACGDVSSNGCRSERGNCRSDRTSISDFCRFDPPGSEHRIGLESNLIWQNPDLYHLNCLREGSESIDVHTKPLPPRCSSKRTRAAEVHNLSEKRRRSRINEKMKALQMLIPNSNKTDKASMLDEAIEYLKQLQLQVQLLSLRNGLTLHPGCIPGMVPLTQTGFGSGERLSDRNGSMGGFDSHPALTQAAPGHPGSDSSLCL